MFILAFDFWLFITESLKGQRHLLIYYFPEAQIQITAIKSVTKKKKVTYQKCACQLPYSHSSIWLCCFLLIIMYFVNFIEVLKGLHMFFQFHFFCCGKESTRQKWHLRFSLFYRSNSWVEDYHVGPSLRRSSASWFAELGFHSSRLQCFHCLLLHK